MSHISSLSVFDYFEGNFSIAHRVSTQCLDPDGGTTVPSQTCKNIGMCVVCNVHSKCNNI